MDVFFFKEYCFFGKNREEWGIWEWEGKGGFERWEWLKKFWICEGEERGEEVEIEVEVEGESDVEWVWDDEWEYKVESGRDVEVERMLRVERDMGVERVEWLVRKGFKLEGEEEVEVEGGEDVGGE